MLFRSVGRGVGRAAGKLIIDVSDLGVQIGNFLLQICNLGCNGLQRVSDFLNLLLQLGGDFILHTFQLGIQGSGILALECHCPREELIEVVLQNDVLKVDGNFAIAWSGSLDFTVERSGKSLIGSAASGEGLVNVYRGTGKVWLAPVQRGLA